MRARDALEEVVHEQRLGRHVLRHVRRGEVAEEDALPGGRPYVRSHPSPEMAMKQARRWAMRNDEQMMDSTLPAVTPRLDVMNSSSAIAASVSPLLRSLRNLPMRSALKTLMTLMSLKTLAELRLDMPPADADAIAKNTSSTGGMDEMKSSGNHDTR